MVGSASSSTDRSKEAVGMMALHEALRNICLNSDWTYSVFWTIRPRPRSRGGNGCKVGDDSGSLMLMWEDGFCRGKVSECLKEMDNEDPVRKAFSKMSIQLYNYGEGLMGKVASDKCHKWVFKEPSECEPNISDYWQSSLDALPSEWTEQFNSGIQTIAVIQAGHGLLQLGSCKIIPEDLHFVLRMRHTFESLGFQTGFYLSQLFSSNRDLSSFSSSSLNVTKHPSVCPPPIFNWNQRSIPCATNFQNNANIAFPPKDGIQLCHLPHSNETLIGDMVTEHDSDIKWPSGLSFFTAVKDRSEDAKLLLGEEGLSKQSIEHNPFVSTSKMPMNFSRDPDLSRAISEGSNTEMGNLNEYLSLESHPSNDRQMENRFKRSFTSPERIASSSSSMDHHSQQQPVNYRSSEARIYPDIMENFLN